tara:strand:- start:123 stop:287 length:165 start_codon:yes stop_codon:yes gene_type:complete
MKIRKGDTDLRCTSGKSIELNGCQVAVFENGKMKKSTQYYNMITMMAQLGLMPD